MSLSSLLSSKHTNTHANSRTYILHGHPQKLSSYYLLFAAFSIKFSVCFYFWLFFFSCFQVLNNLSAAKWQRILFHSRNAENGRTKHQIDFNAIWQAEEKKASIMMMWKSSKTYFSFFFTKRLYSSRFQVENKKQILKNTFMQGCSWQTFGSSYNWSWWSDGSRLMKLISQYSLNKMIKSLIKLRETFATSSMN